MTRGMPVATIRKCRRLPGFIDGEGRMICGCCHRAIDDTRTPSDAARFEGER